MAAPREVGPTPRRTRVTFGQDGLRHPRAQPKAGPRVTTVESHDDGSSRATSDGSLLLAVSNEMVRLFKDQFGRWPTKARSSWAGPDVLICVLEDTLTP